MPPSITIPPRALSSFLLPFLHPLPPPLTRTLKTALPAPKWKPNPALRPLRAKPNRPHRTKRIEHKKRQIPRFTLPLRPRPAKPQSVIRRTAPIPLPVPIADLPPLPYHVHRTPSNQLPVYQLAKRGGNLQQTRIRKIQGDVQGLRDELQKDLGLKEEHVVINQLTRHIMIKGLKRIEVLRFLEERQF